MVASVFTTTNGQDKTATGTTVVTGVLGAVTQPYDVIVAWVSFDNTSATAPTVTALTKPAGETNSWVLMASHDSPQSLAGNGVRGEMWAIQCSVAWPSTQTIQATLSAITTAKAISVIGARGVGLTKRQGNYASTNGSGTPMSLTTGAIIDPLAGDLVLAAASSETATALATDTDTLNGSWSAVFAQTTGGLGQTNVVSTLQYKIITADGDQFFDQNITDGGMVILSLIATQIVTPDSVSSAESVGSPQLNQKIYPDGIQDSPWEGTEPWIGTDVWGQRVGNPTVSVSVPAQTVSPNGIASAEAVGSPTVSPGAVTVSPTGIASAQAIGGPTVTSAVTVSPGGISSAEAFGSPTLTSAITVSPTGIASAQSIGAPTVSSTVTVNPSGIGSAEAVGPPTVAIGAVTVTPNGVASAESVGSPTLTATVTVSPAGIASAESIGSPAVTSLATVTPNSIGTAESVGAPTLTAQITVSPNGITSAESIGPPTVTSLVTLSPTGIGSAESVGSPTITAQITIAPNGVASAESVGNPTVSPGAVTVSPTGIGSAEALGAPTVSNITTVAPNGIGSAETVGSPTVTAFITVSPAGIGSAEDVGAPVISAFFTIQPAGIASVETIGVPRVYRVVVGEFPPDGIAEQTNLTGALSSVQDDPDTPDGTWMTGSGNVRLRLTWPTPGGDLEPGPGQQKFRVLVRPS